MNITIIGAGNVGGALATAAARAGHSVTISASTPEHAAAAAQRTGTRAAASNLDAVDGADLVVLAVPAGAVSGVLLETGHALAGTVVVDATNPLTADMADLTTSGRSAAEEAQDQVPAARVVKALNTLLASRLVEPTQDGVPLDAFLAGDDAAAKDVVTEFVASLGYRPVDVGGLRLARSLEEMALLHIGLNARNGWTWQSAYVLIGPVGAPVAA